MSNRNHHIWGGVDPSMVSLASSGQESGSTDTETMRMQRVDRMKDVIVHSDNFSEDEEGDKGTERSSSDLWRYMLRQGPPSGASEHGTDSVSQSGSSQDEGSGSSWGWSGSNRSWADQTEEEMIEDMQAPLDGDAPEKSQTGLHKDGQCRPCHYLNTKVGCMSGDSCNFCHLDHPGRQRPRPSKYARMKCKRMVNELDAVKTEKPEEFGETLKKVSDLSMSSRYLQTVLRSKFRNSPEEEALAARGEGSPTNSEKPKADQDPPDEALVKYASRAGHAKSGKNLVSL